MLETMSELVNPVSKLEDGESKVSGSPNEEAHVEKSTTLLQCLEPVGSSSDEDENEDEATERHTIIVSGEEVNVEDTVEKRLDIVRSEDGRPKSYAEDSVEYREVLQVLETVDCERDSIGKVLELAIEITATDYSNGNPVDTDVEIDEVKVIIYLRYVNKHT